MPNLKMFPLHCIPQVLYTANSNIGSITPVKIFSYDLPVRQSTFVTYRRADGRQTTTMPRKEAVQH